MDPILLCVECSALYTEIVKYSPVINFDHFCYYYYHHFIAKLCAINGKIFTDGTVPKNPIEIQ